ncbi:hypothetical protein C5Y96_01960 [Blastopirellula marina]|uniref:Tox-REase-3 domain-containing protein n=1 Tax=Blastopirellula marina TaxID=124 RepID=A0A2S8G7K0_9BACT|nr:hypothetical protein C5Y96_01960 [Blastopirellula marina]RCS55795.1 hypothetical protein DTL36_01965 [Bremerella cremea]
MRVAEDHTYFVGADDWGFSVWVHNRYEARQLADGAWEVYHTVDGSVEGVRYASKIEAEKAAKLFNEDAAKAAAALAENGGLGKLVKVHSPDSAADALAKRLGGESRVKFSNGPGNEFDAVSDLYVAQSKPANFVVNKVFRDQAKATFETAIQSGRKPYFHFEGPPHRDVLRKLEEYGKRYGVEPVIDFTPLN